MINKISCVIPAYNEEENITEVINSLKKYVDEIIVVDDGSIDKTFDLAKDLNVKVLKHIINRGQGAALSTGTEYALKNKADIIIHFDADRQFVADEINDIIEPIIKREADAVFGSRFLSKKSNIPWLKKYFIIPMARLVNTIFLGVKFTDPQSGFRAMSRIAASKIKIEQDGMAHCSEILYKIKNNNFKAKEIPVTVIYHDFGQKFSGGIKIIKELLFGRIIN